MLLRRLQASGAAPGRAASSTAAAGVYVDVPRERRRWERKPYLTPVQELVRRARSEKKNRPRSDPLSPPPPDPLLAAAVFSAWRRLRRRLPSLPSSLHRCRSCGQIHLSPAGGHLIRSCDGKGGAARRAAHDWAPAAPSLLAAFPSCFRLLQPRVAHCDRHVTPRLPAVLELCLQAGLQTDPDDDDDDEENLLETGPDLAETVLAYWMTLRDGAASLMTRFPVLTCGFCDEVQVGAKGHKVRLCRAAGHQNRAGLHAWQEADVDHLLGTKFVWHVRDPHGPPLVNELKRYYGKAPAVVEACVQAGAAPPPQFASMMRLDVVIPAVDECDLVA